MNVVTLQRRPRPATKRLAALRANRDAVRDIGADSKEQRQTDAIERLEDTLRFFRTAYDSPTLAKALETKLAAEKRIAGRLVRTDVAGESRPPLIKPDIAARSCECLLTYAVEMMLDAVGVAKDGRLTLLARQIQKHAESIDDELLPDIRALCLKLEAEARC